MKALHLAAAVAVVVLAGCGPRAAEPAAAQQVDADPPPLPPELETAAKRLDARLAAQGRAADAAHAVDGRWSASAERAQSGPLQRGDPLSGPERFALADACHEAAGSEVDSARIRIEKGPPDAVVTCMLVSGRPVTVKIDEEGEVHRVR